MSAPKIKWKDNGDDRLYEHTLTARFGTGYLVRVNTDDAGGAVRSSGIAMVYVPDSLSGLVPDDRGTALMKRVMKKARGES